MHNKIAALPLMIALLSAGCARQGVPDLPTEPLEQAATCGVVAAATERETAGVKGDLSADAQARILHYAMLYASAGKGFDAARVNAVSQRMPPLFDGTIKGEWKGLRASCATAFPATQITAPQLPPTALARQLDCYALADFLRKALSSQGTSYDAAINSYNQLTGKLDIAMTPALRAAGIHNGDQLNARRAEALAEATKLGQPSGVLMACEKAYG